MPKKQHSIKVPTNMQHYYQIITELTDSFCKNRLNDEYQQLARYATAALCRKKPSPLMSGRPNTWACAIIHALGTVNFLFDKSHEPFIIAADLAEAFDVSTSNAGIGQSKFVNYLTCSDLTITGVYLVEWMTFLLHG